MNNFPHFFQKDKYDCGQTCIKIISAYYNIVCDMAELTNSKLSIYDINTTLNRSGINSKALQIHSKDKINELKFPFIALLRNKHFVVAYSNENGFFFLSDPEKGRIKIVENAFVDQLFENPDKIGKIISVKNKDINEIPKKYASFLYSTFKDYIPFFRNFGILIFIINILQALIPFLFRAIIDLGINKNNLSFVNIIVAANFLLIIGIGMGNVIKDSFSQRISEEFDSKLKKNFLEKILSTTSILSNIKIGHLLNKIKDIEEVSNFLSKNVFYFINSCFLTLIYLLIVFFFNHFIFFILIISILAFVACQLFFISYSKLLENDSRQLQVHDRNFWSDIIGSIFDIKIYGLEKQQQVLWEENQNLIRENHDKSLKVKNKQNFLNHLITGLKNLAILYFSVVQVLDGKMTFGTLISIQFIVGYLNSPIQSIINFISTNIYFRTSLSRLEEEYKILNKASINKEAQVDLNFINTIQYHHVSLNYPNSATSALTNINLKILKGKKYAFIGKSGSGKSTVLKILLGLIDISQGQMEINNIAFPQLNIDKYRQNFSVVLQESKLVPGSFIDNITYNSYEVNFERLNEVIELTNLSDIISQYSKGIFSILNNESRGLSMGQKQRILLARALYHNKDYIVLDEATNALDSYNEYIIFNNIKKLYNERTIIVSTHNINLIRDFDVIFVLSNGRIVEVGNHLELVDKKGHYNILYNTLNKK